MKCFYHDDLDGHCSAYWISTICSNNECIEENFIKINYGDEFPFDKINIDEKVYIVDYSIPPNEMEQLLYFTKNVVWIDHHISAIDKYKDFKHHIDGIRYNGIAGCELTYLYVTHNGNGYEIDYNIMRNNIPKFTKLIGDYDVWAFKYKDSKDFVAGMLSEDDTHPLSYIWEDLDDDSDKYYRIIANGQTINKFTKIENKKLIDRLAYEVTFENYSALVINTTGGSEVFESVTKKYDLYILYTFDGEKYTVGLRSAYINVSDIAKKRGGGEHVGAAGFTCKILPF